MGICLSCLGLNQSPSDEEPSETERLLYDETTAERSGYGGAGPGSRIPAPDPEEQRRHREMLESICAETANNLIDVPNTNLLTLRGKPSAEFATLLNTHFANPTPADPEANPTSPSQSRTLPPAPQTPNPSGPSNPHSSSPPEPPSPFTQAQLAAAAAAASGSASNTTTTTQGSTRSPSSNGPRTPQRQPVTSAPQQQGGKDGHGGDETELDADEAEEEAWLASITPREQRGEQQDGEDGRDGGMRWEDEIRAPEGGLVLRLDGGR